MSKKQKVWLWVFLGMFIVPEVFWGAILKVFKLSFLPIYKDAQIFYDNPSFGLLILVVEFIGIIGSIMLTNKTRINKYVKFLLILVLVLIELFLIAALISSYTLSHISFP